MTQGQFAGELAVCVGLTRSEVEQVWSSVTAPPHRVLCGSEVAALQNAEPSPDLSPVRCAAELPFLSHCADEVVLSARLLPNAVLLAEARRVLAPHGLIGVMPSVLGRWDEAELEQIVSELEAAGLVVDADPTAEWNRTRVIFAHVPHRRW